MKPNDKWVIDGLYKDYEEHLPLFEFLEYSIANWSLFTKKVKDKYKYLHGNLIPHIPDLTFLSTYLQIAVEMFVTSKEEV